jgi:hypothetical protein
LVITYANIAILMAEGDSLFLRRVFSRLFNRSRESGGSADLDRLTRLARRFSIERQQVPKDLDELVAYKYLAVVPPAPIGQRFVVDRKTVEVRLEQGVLSTEKLAPEAGPGLVSPRIISDPN